MFDFFDFAELETLGFEGLTLIDFATDWRFANERKNCPTLDRQN